MKYCLLAFRRSVLYLVTLLRRWNWKRALGRITSIKDFRDYVSKVQPDEFLRLENASHLKKMEFLTFVDEIGINLEGKRVLEIGPGYEDVLDICRERGAKTIDFIDYDPFFFTYNSLKGFRGYHIDHRVSLMRLKGKIYDFIWIKGSVAGDYFVIPGKLGLRWFSSWLAKLDSLSSSDHQIVITPHWALNSGRQEIICSNVVDSPFSKVMLRSNYKLLKKIEYLNDSIQYPITFLKSKVHKAE